MKEIKELFPLEVQPFYAGFGNRDTDYISYKSLSVTPNKIFIINPKGQIKQFNHLFYDKSYPMINEMVDMMFPSIEPIDFHAYTQAPHQDSGNFISYS